MKSGLILTVAAALALCSCGGPVESGQGNLITVSLSNPGGTIPNIVDNVNVWDMGTIYHDVSDKDPYADVYSFVKYVQLMQCTGGEPVRDLFIDPMDRSVLTDYKFDGLARNCRGILELGAKPFLKLGNVPMKMSSNPKRDYFSINIYPPDSYEQYYDYIRAITEYLVAEFGLEEVRSWRFGCMTEYDNYYWFMAPSGDPHDTMVAFCKLYDWTVQALTDVLGTDIFVGAHSMTHAEGPWREEDFIEHVAKGVNWANGGVGTPIKYLSASFYDDHPLLSREGDREYHSLSGTIAILQKAAEENGLTDLQFGVDEGRLFNGNFPGVSWEKGSQGSMDLLASRVSGYTWQAAYDARLFKEAIDCGMDWFSSWAFLSGGQGNLKGIPTVGYHVAENIAAFEGYSKLEVSEVLDLPEGSQVECLAGVKGDTLKLMVYNFNRLLDRPVDVEFKLQARVPFRGRKAKVERRLVGDGCNYFDDWEKDRKERGIGGECFYGSPDDASTEAIIIDPKVREIFSTELHDKYVECSRLIPEVTTEKLTRGELSLDISLPSSNVLFLTVTR